MFIVYSYVTYSPPTSVTIQSGIAKLLIANMSAIKKNIPDIAVSLSIVAKFSLYIQMIIIICHMQRLIYEQQIESYYNNIL